MENKDFRPSKTCGRCKEEKPLSSFPIDRSKHDQLHSQCKECKQSSRKRWARKNTKKTRKYNLKRKYDITPEEYSLLLDKQNYKCYICSSSKEDLKRGLFVDHNHDTGEVRGLLCHHCNSGLGMFKDNVDLLNKAIEYLEINKSYKVSST